MPTPGAFKSNTMDMGTDALKPIIRKFIGQDRKDYAPIYPIYTEEMKTEDFFEKFGELGGFPDAPLKDEGDYLNLAKAPAGDQVDVQPEVRQLAFAITREDKKFNRIDKVQRLTKKLSRAMIRTKERVATVPLNLGFSSTLNLGVDSQPLFSATHVNVGGVTFSNLLAVDLSMASLETAITMFMTMVDNDGTPIVVTPKYLVVHPNNYLNAKRIVGSANYFTNGASGSEPASQQPGTQAWTGAPNAIQDMGITVVPNPYLTDVDAWYLLGPKGEEDNIVFVWNEDINDYIFEDQWTRDTVTSMQMSNVGAWLTPIGLVASSGG